MKQFQYLYLFVFLLVKQVSFAQETVGGYAWGVRSGLTVGMQKWGGSGNRDPLLRYHGLAFIESIGDGKNALYSQLGYHVRGSAIRYFPFQDPITGTWYGGGSETYQFRNISLSFGAKQKFPFKKNIKYFYSFGLRGDFTINTNLPKEDEIYSLYFPYDSGTTVKRLNAGLDIGGGFELPISDLVGGVLQFTFSPDFTRQYFQFPINNIRDPFTGQITTIPQQEIKNLSFEVSLGLRFLRKIIYED